MTQLMMSFAFFLEVLLRESVSKLEMPWKLDLLSEGDPLQVFSIHLIPWHLLFDCGNKNINSLIFRCYEWNFLWWWGYEQYFSETTLCINGELWWKLDHSSFAGFFSSFLPENYFWVSYPLDKHLFESRQ